RPGAATGVHRTALDTPSSSALQPALRAFAQLLADAQVQEVIQRRDLTPRWLTVDAAGAVQVHNVSGAVFALSNTHTLPVAALPGVATRFGGQVRSDGQADISDMLAAHGGCGPREAAHADGAARCVERLLAELRLG